MGEAKRRKDAGEYPEQTPKPPADGPVLKPTTMREDDEFVWFGVPKKLIPEHGKGVATKFQVYAKVDYTPYSAIGLPDRKPGPNDVTPGRSVDLN